MDSLFEATGSTRPETGTAAETPYDRAAALVEGLAVETVLDAVGLGG
jgi:hypothetical protein